MVIQSTQKIQIDSITTQEVGDKFDTIAYDELTKRLKRQPSIEEIINADTDSDLINEIYYQMIIDLTARVKVLETQLGITPKTP